MGWLLLAGIGLGVALLASGRTSRTPATVTLERDVGNLRRGEVLTLANYRMAIIELLGEQNHKLLSGEELGEIARVARAFGDVQTANVFAHLAANPPRYTLTRRVGRLAVGTSIDGPTWRRFRTEDLYGPTREIASATLEELRELRRAADFFSDEYSASVIDQRITEILRGQGFGVIPTPSAGPTPGPTRA